MTLTKICFSAMTGLLALAAAPVLADDIADGQLVYKQMCSACHKVTPDQKNGMGPNLFGLVGRKVGSAPGFTYSATLKADNAAGEVWSKDKLSTFLAAPQQVKPGTKMTVAVKDDIKRARLIAYLASLKP